MRNNWNGPCVSHTLTLNKEQGQDVWSYHPNLTAGTLIHCWGECKMVQPLWRTVRKLLTKLNVLYPYNPGIMLLVIYPIFFPINLNFYPINILHIIVSVQFSRSVVSNSLRPHGLQHARLPCPSPTPRACSNSCPLSWWCHPTISSSVVPFSSHLQSFPASGSFPVSHLFTSGSQSLGALASAWVLPMNIQGWFPLSLTSLISLQFKGLSRVFSHNTVQKHQFFDAQPSLWSNSHIHSWLLEKP